MQGFCLLNSSLISFSRRACSGSFQSIFCEGIYDYTCNCSNGSQLEAIFLPRGCLGLCGDIFGCRRRFGGRSCPPLLLNTPQRTGAPMTVSSPAPNVKSAMAEKPSLPDFLHIGKLSIGTTILENNSQNHSTIISWQFTWGLAHNLPEPRGVELHLWND